MTDLKDKIMTAKRVVREDFDLTKEYNVFVGDCTEEQKKAIQQAFFDVGITWEDPSDVHKRLDAVQYSNAYGSPVTITNHLLYGNLTHGCNMTAKAFLDLVYVPAQVGHVHAELMAQYAVDAKTTKTPWELWQLVSSEGMWTDCTSSPLWLPSFEYRRKPKTHTVNGVEIPDFRFTPKCHDNYYLVSTSTKELASQQTYVGDSSDKLWVERGLVYQYSEEGKEAAILHSKAMLGIATCL